MSIYKRDTLTPEWEPIPWDAPDDVADEQERGFYARATAAIVWSKVPFADFPAEGIFGRPIDWFRALDIEYFATHAGEELVLLHNFWSGWPDPPEWGLASRPCGNPDGAWSRWGHFDNMPASWSVPDIARAAATE